MYAFTWLYMYLLCILYACFLLSERTYYIFLFEIGLFHGAERSPAGSILLWVVEFHSFSRMSSIPQSRCAAVASSVGSWVVCTSLLFFRLCYYRHMVAGHFLITNRLFDTSQWQNNIDLLHWQRFSTKWCDKLFIDMLYGLWTKNSKVTCESFFF